MTANIFLASTESSRCILSAPCRPTFNLVHAALWPWGWSRGAARLLGFGFRQPQQDIWVTSQHHTLRQRTPHHCTLQHCTVQHCTLQQHHTLQHCTPQPCTLLCITDFSAEPPTVQRITEAYFCVERFWSCLGIVVQSCDPRTPGVRGRKSKSSKPACLA